MDEGFKEWEVWRARMAVVSGWANQDDAAGIASATDAQILAAEAALAHSTQGPKSLVEMCLARDSAKVLVALMNRPAWRGALCSGRDDWTAFPVKMGLAAVDAGALNCLKAISSQSRNLAWRLAGRCVEENENRASKKNKGYWSAGFEAAVELAVETPAPMSNHELSNAVAATERAFEAASLDLRFLASATRAAQALMAIPEAKVHLLGAFIRLACEAGPAQKVAWSLFKELSPAGAIEAKPVAWFGLATGPKPMRNRSLGYHREQPICSYPPAIDPAWIAALHAVDDEGVKVAREMGARRAAVGRDGRPTLQPSLVALDHPLSKVWEVWSHSNRAGFALPKHPVQVAASAMGSLLAQWEARVGVEAIASWRSVGESVVASLGAGIVPPEFPGFPAAPRVEDAKKSFECQLSPLATLHHSWGSEPSEDQACQFVACARASEAIGSPLAEYARQAEQVLGLRLSAGLMAQAERAQLGDMVETTARKAGAPLRM